MFLYVDDILITSENKFEIKKLKVQLGSKFEMNDSEATKILGMEMKRNKPRSILATSQCKYLSKVVKHFHMDTTKN